MIARSRGFTPSPPTAWLLWVYAFVMLVGAHWTYGQAPPGEWLQGVLNLQRNPWDRIGHLFQGALPALAMFEWRGNRLHAFLAGLSTCLFFEAAEHIATFFTQGDFIQAQGDRFDSLNDLLFAAIGSIAAVLLVKSKAPTRD